MSRRFIKYPTPKAMYSIIDEGGMSLWCKSMCFLIDEHGRRLHPGFEPEVLYEDQRDRFLALADVQEQFLQKELDDIRKAKSILSALEPKKRKKGEKE